MGRQLSSIHLDPLHRKGTEASLNLPILYIAVIPFDILFVQSDFLDFQVKSLPCHALNETFKIQTDCRIHHCWMLLLRRDSSS